MEIQKVKINVLHKAVRAEARSGVSLKIPDVGIEPDGTAQVEGTADLLQCAEYFVVRVSSALSQMVISLINRLSLSSLPHTRNMAVPS